MLNSQRWTNLKRNKRYLNKLIRELLTKDPEDRLGYSEDGSGAEDIKENKFFSRYKFDKILKRKIKSPYSPNIDAKIINKYKNANGPIPGDPKNLEITNGFLGETGIDSQVAKVVKRDFNKEKKKYKDS